MKTTRRTLLTIEALETRAMASVTAVTVSTSSTYGTKQINITTNNNSSNVTIDKTSAGILVKDSTNGYSKTIPTSGLQAIVFIGRDGNDRVVNNVTTLSMRAYGYEGNDYFVGSDKNDILDGGKGNDTLFGNGGHDKLYGGVGIDSLRGGSGDDYLHGGAGNDAIFGESGTDTFRRNLYKAGFSLTGTNPGTSDLESERSDEPVVVSGSFLTEYVDSSTRDSQWDIEQMASPTCAFLSTLSAYAERTGSSNDLIKGIGYNTTTDTYSIRLHINGSWRTYKVNGDWTEGRDPNGKLWVTLYQKAYLSAMGVKSRDNDGRMLPSANWSGSTNYQIVKNAFKALTSTASTFTANSSMNPQTMRNWIYGNIRGMTASSKDTGVWGGIVENHSYMVYDVFVANGGWRVKLYNPWGTDWQNGALTGANDGLIDISWEHFQSTFEGYNLCKNP